MYCFIEYFCHLSFRSLSLFLKGREKRGGDRNVDKIIHTVLFHPEDKGLKIIEFVVVTFCC